MAKKNKKNDVVSSVVNKKTKSDKRKEKNHKVSNTIMAMVMVILLAGILEVGTLAIINAIRISNSLSTELLEQKLTSDNELLKEMVYSRYGQIEYIDGQICSAEGESIHYKHTTVDDLLKKCNDNATIFVREGDEFKRVITNIFTNDGSRAVDTFLDSTGPAYPLMLEGKSYCGKAIILNKPYLVNYEPMISSSGEVFGIYYVGIPISKISEYIRKQTGYTVLVTIILAIISMGLSAIVSLKVTNRIISPILKVVEKLNEVTRGNLTVKFNREANNEVGLLTESIGETVNTLKNLNQKIYVAINILNKNLHTLYVSSTSVKDSANNQAVTVEETQRNFENMNVLIETISQDSEKANGYTSQALTKANIGMESMSKLEIEMGKIVESSKEITNTLGMINEIAEQTNLLSLNASIESARAGEAGKGFNIVAGEIRKLAEKSTNAANRIEELIINNNKIIQDGVRYSKETTNILQEISASSNQNANLVSTISDEIQKVKISSQEVLSAISNISDIALANLNDSEKVSNVMGDFVTQTLELQKFVGQFDIRSDKVKENQSHVEDVLRSKLIEVGRILSDYGAHFLPTGNSVEIGGLVIPELQIGETIVTGNSDLCDIIAEKTKTSVTIFQPTEDAFIRVATTVRNFDDSRAVGTMIGKDSKVYQSVIQKKEYFGRAFVVNKWFVAVYKPILDETGYLLGVLYLGLPEDDTEEQEENED